MSKITRLTGREGGDANGQRLHLRELPGEVDSPAESVGQDLRAARLRRGDEIGHISQALRIRRDYLEAIESDWPERLPGRTYAIGFVRSYAKYLELDAPTLVSRYKLAHAGQTESAPRVGPAPTDADARRLSLGWTAVALVVVGLLVYGVWQLSEPHPSQGETAAVSPSVSAIPAPPKDPGAGSKTAPAHDAVSVKSSSPASPSAAQAAANGAGPGAAAYPADPSTGEVYGKQNLNARVILHARAPIHILVQGANEKIYISKFLHPGDVYRVPNLAGLSLSTPDGGALGVELDGRDAGPAGESGQATEALSLDPGAIAGRRGGGATTGGAE